MRCHTPRWWGDAPGAGRSPKLALVGSTPTSPACYKTAKKQIRALELSRFPTALAAKAKDFTTTSCGLERALVKWVYTSGMGNMRRKELREMSRRPPTIPQCICDSGNLNSDCPYWAGLPIFVRNQETGSLEVSHGVSTVPELPLAPWVPSALP